MLFFSFNERSLGPDPAYRCLRVRVCVCLGKKEAECVEMSYVCAIIGSFTIHRSDKISVALVVMFCKSLSSPEVRIVS